MGRHARIGLLLGAAACLVAVMVDWVVEELREEDSAAREDTLAEPAATKEPAPAESAAEATAPA